MKKFLAIAIVLVLIAGFMVGCNENGYEPVESEIENETIDTNGQGEYTRPFNAQTDFIWLNITIEQADELFGELLEVHEFNNVVDGAGMARVYNGVTINFAAVDAVLDEDENSYIFEKLAPSTL